MRKKARAISITGVLTALSFILFIYMHFPIMPAPFTQMFKMDFADIPALLVSVCVSPFLGVLVVFVRNLLHFLLLPDPFFLWIGEVSNFIISGYFVFIVGAMYGWILKYNINEDTIKVRLKKQLVMAVVAVLTTIAVASMGNYFYVIPEITRRISPTLVDEIGGKRFHIVAGVIPFNAIKSTINYVVFAIIYDRLISKIRQYL